MAAAFLRFLGAVLATALLLSGCARAPAPPPRKAVGPVEPVPGGARLPQEVALEQALGDFYGAPYRSGGCEPSGVDCSGFIQAMYHRAGINLPRTVAQQYSEGRPVNREELRFGDVVFFNRYCQTQSQDFFLASMFGNGAANEVCHNGFYLGESRFVHASPRGVCVSRLDAEVWKVSYRGARRYLPGR